MNETAMKGGGGASAASPPPSTVYPAAPPGFWDREELDPDEIAKYCSVGVSPETLQQFEMVVREMECRPVPTDTRDLVFDMVPPSHGLDVAYAYERIAQYCAAPGMGRDGEHLATIRPEDVLSDPELSRASALIAPLLDPAAWAPVKDNHYFRSVKNRIISPYLAVLNTEVSQRPPGSLHVLVLGSWSGADVMRVAIARQGTKDLEVDTFDPYAEGGWDREFRDIALERYGQPVRGQHYACSPLDLHNALGVKKYDMIIAVNSLHQWLSVLPEFDALLDVISEHLAVDGVILGMTPTLEGFRTIEDATDTCVLSVTPAAPVGGAPFGRMRVMVAGQVMEDPVLPVDVLISAMCRKGIFLETMTAFQSYLRFPTHVRFGPPGPETRGYLVLRGRRQPTSAFYIGRIHGLQASPRILRIGVDTSMRKSESLFSARDHGALIDLDDSWFVRSVPFYVSEKTDGEGVMVSVTGVGDKLGLLTVRSGDMVRPVWETYSVGYDGPDVVFEAERLRFGDEQAFIAYGLIRHATTEGFNWYSGISLLTYWLETQHLRGNLRFVGTKGWDRATRRTIQLAWNAAKEGLVFKYVSAPPSSLQGSFEKGTAKYVKKTPTVDIRVRQVIGGGIEPPVVGCPSGYDRVVECSVGPGGEYRFIRERPDKHVGDSPVRIQKILEASTIDDVLRWVDEQTDLLPHCIDLDEDGDWASSLRESRVLLPVEKRLELAATGVRPILFMEGTVDPYEIPLAYEWRAQLFKDVMAGAYDSCVRG